LRIVADVGPSMSKVRPEAEIEGGASRAAQLMRVDRTIVRQLVRQGVELNGKLVFDVSCREGVLLASLEKLFPLASLEGVNLETLGWTAEHEEHVCAKTQAFGLPAENYDVIIWRSGMINPGSLSMFFEICAYHLAEGGLFIVASCNPVMAEARLASMFADQAEPVGEHTAGSLWNTLHVEKMMRYARSADLRVRGVAYVPMTWTDAYMLPAAALLWMGQTAVGRFLRPELVPRLRQLFPFSSLMSRHYVLILEKQ
jgi:hypothetical protein